ncbi:hypothetical protein BHE74_00037420 [Ensete ventricosum]|nr:hypothetical protein BHE74_00037420 [Ensete ventricosum]RZR95458.1 hypothetical protein BHM03_00024310 [Ensete ventricosum]
MFLHSLLMQRQKHPQKRQARICTLSYLSFCIIIVSELSDSTRIILPFKLFMILEDLDQWLLTFQEIMVW